jgi:glycosyltransferase involved in cell wall biosynthesis
MTEPYMTTIESLLVDPSLFTAPYDAALTEGLVASGVEPMWATRPQRQNDRQEIPVERVDPFFYRRVDEALSLPSKLRAVAKGLSHIAGLCVLVARVITRKPDVVHFQWTVVPPVDGLAIAVIRLFRPVVLTVHDTVAFNGERISWFQNLGFDWPIRLADRLIVHTRTGKQTLIARGVPADKVSVIPHGPLRLHVTPPTAAEIAQRDPRWTFVLFGEIKPYKGLDLLVEALAALPEATRLKARLVVAGRPRMDLTAIEARIAELGLGSVIEFRARRQSEEEMALLFAQADCFVFPYHQIDASGVYFLTKAFSKWMIASRVGIFAEDMRENIDGRLIPVGSVEALTEALAHAIEARPSGAGAQASDSWTAIGHQTRALYESTLHARAKRLSPSTRG